MQDRSKRSNGTVTHLAISVQERCRLLRKFRYLHFPAGVDGNHEVFLQHANRVFQSCFPPETVTQIREWHADRRRSGVLIVDGVGIDDPLPPTPTDGKRSPDKLTTFSEMILAGVGAILGEVFAFENERHGDLIQDLTPRKGKEAALTNEGTQRLGWHTEHAATGYLLGPDVNVCEYLLFFGLRQDPQQVANTLVADIRDALHLLSPSTIETLRRPEFLVRPPLQVRARLPIDRQSITNVPVLTGLIEHPMVRVALYGDLCEGMTPEACRALDSLVSALDAVQRGLPTVPGRLVLVDNRMVLHSRSPFTPAYDGNDRWLQRAMVTSSLRLMQPWQQKSLRVLTPSF